MIKTKTYKSRKPRAGSRAAGGYAPITMKQELDEVRTLAIKLFEAGEAEKRKQPKHIWGETRTWRDLPSESVAVWDAIALCAFRETVKLQTAKLMALKKTTPRHRPPSKIHVHASQQCGTTVSTPTAWA